MDFGHHIEVINFVRDDECISFLFSVVQTRMRRYKYISCHFQQWRVVSQYLIRHQNEISVVYLSINISKAPSLNQQQPIQHPYMEYLL